MTYTTAALEAELPSQEMTDLVTEILASSLRSLGLFTNGIHRLADLPLDQQPAAHHERWLSSSIGYLQQQSVLTADFSFSREVRVLADLWQEWATKLVVNPSLEACLRGLPAVLTGKQRATDVVSLNSSTQQPSYFHDVLGATLSACIEQQLETDPERRFRILEIGPGAGVATAALLPVLQRYPVEEYRYTDVSEASLAQAEQNFRPRFPALTTAIFDVSKPLNTQAIAVDHYDFAIAVNVLHATSNIREALRNAKATLRNEGVLLLSEISAWSLFDHLTFGLLEQWWQYEDAAMRLPGSPALAPEKWREVLAQEGFESIVFPAEEAHKFGRQIVAAVSNGWTRQRIVRQAAPQRPAAVEPVQVTVQEIATPKPRPSHSASPTTEMSKQMSTDYTRQIITAKLAEALMMDGAAIRGDASFADFGVDSIVGVKLVQTISEALQIELEAMSLFEYSTVDDLAQYVLKTWPEQIAAQVAQLEGTSQATSAVIEEAPVEVETRPANRFTGVTRFSNVRNAFDVAEESDSAAFGADPIAVIGMSGRFAQSESLEAFWQHLAEGKDLVQQVSRWSPADCVMSDAASHGHCSHGSFIDSIDQFDPAFFGISALEATYMDPQQRLFLEESWRALEDAGYAGRVVHEKQCGVYVGCGSSHYDKLSGGNTPAHAFWGNSQAVTPARIAYFLNLQGPALAVDTACSSSLVAIHLACQGLWARETEMALAGGVFLQPTPGFYQVANRAGMLSADGKTYSFDARANGFVPGEGVGVVVLKRLRDALADGDHIHGVIAGSGINQDGKSNGLTAPNGRAQERLERAVYDRFKINPETIQVVEAHGTGTLLGDSVEIGALSRAFREHTDKTQFCALGSVKTNIGHASTAAGVAGVLKLLLSMKHGQIAPSLHFEKGNPAIDLASGPFYVNTLLQPWVAEGDEPRRAVVSSFGFSGTNAHLVLEEAPAVERAAVESPASMVVLSARTAEQLRQQARNLLAHLERTPGLSMTDLSFSLLVGRTHLSHRLSCIARNQNELIRLLGQWIEAGAANQVYTAEIQEGRIREQASLKKFGNYCIEECKSATNAAVYVENLAAIAELYVQGYSLDFQSLFSTDARRIPLPTYPFARERYWVDGAQATAPRSTATPIVTVPRAPETKAVSRERSTFTTSGGDLRGWLQNELTQMIAESLNLQPREVSPEKVLVDLGFDSIGLTNFANALNQKFGLDLTPVLFFDYPSVSEIAKYLSVERKNEVRPFHRESAGTTAFVAPQSTPEEPATPARVEIRSANEPIAIVGIAGVMPQSEDLDVLWENLKDAKDLVTVIPEDRWNWEDYYGDPIKERNKSNSKWGGFMKEVDKFDPLFFGISPREAQMMDPQQRIFLETVWKAIEDSGQKVSDLSGTRTGLFVGVGSNDYLDIMRGLPVALDGYTASGNSHSVLANRVSFLLNLRGPSAPIDTACSSSLIALHRAIESIHSGSSDMAIVGGVQVILSPGGYISFGAAGMLSGDGKCKSFDKRANGYVRGEGCGAMLLKPLSKAEADGNHIYAVIRATSENHGGRVTTMTAPNSAAQAALVIEAFEKAQIDPATVGYIECHGTGTSLGDPIEIQALSKAFSELYKRRDQAPAAMPHVGLGAVKTNIGHLETAAGIAGVLKVVLAMKHKQIPANVHFEELNPFINLKGTPFYIADKLTPWEAPADDNGSPVPRRAGVSSFGFGGANAHAVLEEYIAPERSLSPPREPQLIVLSAKNEDRLRAYVQSMRAYLESREVELVDFAYTLQVGRDEMPERLALVVSTTEELRRKFDAILAGERPQDCYRGNVTNVTNAEGTSQPLIERNDLSRLAELWVSGVKIDWRLLHEAGVARRISAPTYPFARERYWIPGADGKVHRTTAIAREEEAKAALQSFVPVWNPVRLEMSKQEDRRIALLGSDSASLDWVRRSYPRAELVNIEQLRDGSFDQLLWVAPDSNASIVEQQGEGVLAVFRVIKSLLDLGYGDKNLQWTIVTRRTQQVTKGESIQPAHAAVAGLVGSLAKEYPRWDLRLVDVDSLASVTAQECLSLPWDKQGNALAHRRGEWFQQGLEVIESLGEAKPLYRKNGVYVVIGGAGGIGEVWSRFMIERYRAKVVWIGRRPADAAIEQKIDALSKLGQAPLYISADATDFGSLEQARNTILKTYPAIHGLVHSALVLQDQSIARMDESTFKGSLAAKIDVSVNMDRVFGGQELDFMLFFSSIVSFVKSAGQSNYSAGCTFKDSFAHTLQQQRPYPVKIMNWGYWGEVGAVADEAHRKNMARLGLGSIEPQEGMASLEALVNSELPQIALVKTVNAKPASAQRPAAVVESAPVVTDHIRRIITGTLCNELRLDAGMIRNDAQLADYGVDSIVGVNLVRGISEALQIDLDPSSLFEYSTVNRLTEHIEKNWSAQIAAQLPAVPVAAAAPVVTYESRLHPLLHTNTSTLGQQSYRTTFTGTEPFLEEQVLPQGACLEMARAAIELAAGIPQGCSVVLHDIVWGEPIVIAGSRDVTTALLPSDNGQIHFEIYSGEVVHCQGRVTLSSEVAPAPVSIDQLKGQLARLSVPAGDFSLIKLIANGSAHSLETVSVFSPCKGEMFAWTRPSQGKVDVDLIDAAGNVCVQTRGLSFQSHDETIELFLRQQAAQQLQKPLDGIAVDRSYFDLGFSSPAITKFIQAINGLLAENLTPSVLFDYRDIRSLTAYLAATYPHKIAGRTAIQQAATLSPLPRKTFFSGTTRPSVEQTLAELTGEQLLDELLWQEASFDDSYEKVTF
nr:methyltransferase [uncultured bacterium]